MKYRFSFSDEKMSIKQILKQIGKEHGRHPKLSDIEIFLNEGGYGACVVVEYYIEEEDEDECW